VADTHPGLFPSTQQHLLPFLDGGSKRALNASCQLASKHVRPAVTTITFRASNVQLLITVLAESDPSSRYPAVNTLCLDFTSSTFGSPENLQIVRTVAGFTRLLGQLRHLRVVLSHMHGADQQGRWLELVDSIVTQCVQLQSFTVQSLTGSSAPTASVATLCWRAQRQHQQLHQMLSELATAQIPDCAEAMLMAQCSVQSLSDVSLQGGGASMASVLCSLAACKALVQLEVYLQDNGEGSNAAAKEVLAVVVCHTSLERAAITLIGCHPAFDPNNLADQAILLQLTTSAKDLHIVLEATDSEEDCVASNLMPLCNSPSVRGLILYAGQQQEHLCLSHSWKRFSLLRSLDLTDVLLDDSCITALNCLTLLEALGIVIKSTNRVRKPLTRAIMLPRLQDLYVCVNDYLAAEQGVLGADCIFLPDNLLRLLRTP
jgi:hypothetical protein